MHVLTPKARQGDKPKSPAQARLERQRIEDEANAAKLQPGQNRGTFSTGGSKNTSGKSRTSTWGKYGLRRGTSTTIFG